MRSLIVVASAVALTGGGMTTGGAAFGASASGGSVITATGSGGATSVEKADSHARPSSFFSARL